jgi:hypothetical protein
LAWGTVGQNQFYFQFFHRPAELRHRFNLVDQFFAARLTIRPVNTGSIHIQRPWQTIRL